MLWFCVCVVCVFCVCGCVGGVDWFGCVCVVVVVGCCVCGWVLCGWWVVGCECVCGLVLFDVVVFDGYWLEFWYWLDWFGVWVVCWWIIDCV